MERRKFLTITATAAFAVPVLGSLSSYATETKSFQGHKFPDLGYGFNALEPYIDAQTMEIHYTKHHQAYYNNFLGAAKGSELLQTTMEQIFAQMSKYPAAIRNNGGGFYNHNLFWENMTPVQNEMPAILKKAIENDFGSVDLFKEKFAAAGKNQFGSGWAWLVVGNDGKLAVTSTPNQDNPLMDVAEKKGIPLLALDVWEHAYYLKYQNKRADYVDNFWNIVNWDVVNRRFEAASV